MLMIPHTPIFAITGGHSHYLPSPPPPPPEFPAQQGQCVILTQALTGGGRGGGGRGGDRPVSSVGGGQAALVMIRTVMAIIVAKHQLHGTKHRRIKLLLRFFYWSLLS